MTGHFDARQALHDVLSSVVNEEIATKLVDALEKSGAAALMPTLVDNIPLRGIDEKGTSPCLRTRDGLSFWSDHNIVRTIDGSRVIEPGTEVYMPAVGRGAEQVKYINRPIGQS